MIRHFQHLPIRLKITIPILGTLAFMLTWVYFYFPAQEKQVLLLSAKNDAVKSAELFTEAIAHAFAQHDYRLLQKSLQYAMVDSSISYIVVFDTSETQIAGYKAEFFADHSAAAVFADSSVTLTSDIILVCREIKAQDEVKYGYLLLGYSLQKVHQILQNVRRNTVFVAVCSFFLGLVLIHIVSKQMSNSLASLHQKMRKIITTGSYSGDVIISSRDEVGQLADAFNQMMHTLYEQHAGIQKLHAKTTLLNKRLQETNQMKTLFLQNISHHLKTPLTVILGELEVILMKDRSADEYQRVVEILLDESERMEQIVGKLLTLAHADSGNLLTKRGLVNLSQICAMQVRHADIYAQKKHLTIRTRLDPGALILGDSNRLAELVDNLLENAIKYTPDGKCIEIALAVDNGDVQLVVQDEGIGIDEQDYVKIFKRFYRGNNAVKSRTKGTGLGLAICKSIVKAHHGEIGVESVQNLGTKFNVKFRLYQPEHKKLSEVKDVARFT